MLSDEEKRARFEASLRYGGGTHSVEDVLAMVRDGRAQFWPRDGSGDGNIVTELVQYPRFKAINFWLISGCLHDCLALEDEVLEFGRAEGCTVATAAGRRGWGRVAAPTGWRLHSYQFWKPL